MATNSLLTIGNVFDLLKMRHPDGTPVDQVVRALAERDDFARLVPAFPANEGLTHHALRQVSLPTGYLVTLGGSWKASKSQYEPIDEALCTIRSTYQSPKDHFKAYEPAIGQRLLKAEKTGHIMMLNQQVTNLMLNGTTAPNQAALTGLMKRSPYTTYDNKFTFSVGGSGTDLRSCWLMKPGIDTLHFLYNKNHPTFGIEQEDKGEVLIQGLGTSSDEHRWDIMIEFAIEKGICVLDQRALKRICNVPCGVSDNPGVDLINTIIDASIINAPTGGSMEVNANGDVSELNSNWLLMCDERLYSKLVHANNDKYMVYQSDKNIYRTKMSMIGDNIIICRMDALNHEIGSGESAVSAA
ncbi:MAG: major capsid protein [Bacilli bacterium]|jgi:hypothetical protein